MHPLKPDDKQSFQNEVYPSLSFRAKRNTSSVKVNLTSLSEPPGRTLLKMTLKNLLKITIFTLIIYHLQTGEVESTNKLEVVGK